MSIDASATTGIIGVGAMGPAIAQHLHGRVVVELAREAAARR